MFKERPVFGFGPGTYTFQYAPFQRPENLTLISTNSGDLGNTHSEYFNALSEMGLIGFLSWVAVFLSSIYLAMGLIYHPSVLPWVKSLTTAVMLGLFTYYVHAFLNNFTDFDKIAAPFWGYLAIITALRMYHHQHNKSSQTNT
jgi:O-antigen ligase